MTTVTTVAPEEQELVLNKFSKSDLINIIAENLGFTKKDVRAVVNTLFDTISDIIVEGNVITIQKFGRFFVRDAKPRSFKKVNTQEIIEVGERKLPKMRFSKELVSRVKSVNE